LFGMELTRRTVVVYVLLAAFWALVLGWQIQEHERVKESARNNLRNRSRDIANTLGAFVRGLNFRGAVMGDRVQPVLDELVAGHSGDVLGSGEVLSVALLNAQGEPVASAGSPLDLQQTDILQKGERWGRRMLTFVFPVEGVSVSPEAGTNATGLIFLPPFTNTPREPRTFRREGRPPDDRPAETDRPRSGDNERERDRDFREGRPPPPVPGLGERRPGRPFWARRLNDEEYQALIQKRELHGLVLGMSTEAYDALTRNDLWMRCMIAFFATVAVLGSGLAWRNLVKSSELQIRLVRASEMNTHLKEMNLAAAGLAHETRNPLNIIRGLAQMIAKQTVPSPEMQQRSREIIDEADKVAAQLNEFINYSRPREVRRTAVPLGATVAEVVRALGYDLEEKRIRLQIPNEPLTILADEQLLRQALFNLLLNAIQAVEVEGEIRITTEKRNNSEALLEIRDSGPGVPPEHRTEIFKPYFTTQKQGTGLGLAVVQQIVLAHGWEIQCLPNSPKGAVLQISHLKLA
jgi:signal transduction histidine kinase